MGKTGDDRNLPSRVADATGEAVSGSSEGNARRGGGGCDRISGLVGFKCLFVLIISVALFLSAMFLLPPFGYDTDPRDPDLDPRFRDHEIVASFDVGKPASFANQKILQLEDDIFQEMSYDSIKVTVLSVEPSAGPNTTKVVFGVDHDTKHREISPLSLNSVREIFESLLINQSSLRLTKSSCGEPFLFQVLKFPGGITVIPPQQVFVLQKPQILFNFTLNFSIYQIQINFNALASQLKKGLNLAPYENLFVSLSNSKGSTVSPPAIVHASVLLRVGNPRPRAKQLADTIKGSRSKNLGLNNTIFGKVKQVSLSSILPNSTKNGGTNSPAPSPLPYSHHHHHNHHHYHHHHLSPHMAPKVSPAPAAKRVSHVPEASPAKAPSAPPACQFRNRGRQRGNTGTRHSHLAPAPAPYLSPGPSAQPPHPQPHTPSPNPGTRSRLVPSSAPLPHVAFAQTQPPPPRSRSNDRRPDEAAPVSPPPSSYAGSSAVKWTILLVLVAAGLNA
ncbi:PREDICTED: uncharacterized protein LOC104826878 isoform X2 [Tarenaya hassleriana]|uniref:uncharacterized protein LOC104826878 isoform X2 n=1 Tax=Tarenaya hassleriana TaxID=28532 RepID=UPI00053C2C54|nr:PREDICTED: uncharacterized protein LOC104826878 isoform X2 [Tarenaya hassleriana]